MKIALFPPSLDGGGVQRVTLNLAAGFQQAGFTVDMILIQNKPQYADLIPEGVRVVSLESGRAISSILPLMRYLRREQPAVLLAATAPTALVALWARALARSTQVKIVPIEMNTPSAYFSHVRHRQEKLYPTLVRRFYPQADHIVAIAEAMRVDMLEFYNLPADAVQTIHSPVLTPDFQRRLAEPLTHPWLTTDHDRPVILDVARFVPAKDLETLIRAFARVRADRPARLIILGDGPLRGELEGVVTELGLDDDVDLPGFLPNLPYMRAADVFVLSSLFEGLPTVLIEALACSPAVVSTDSAGGAREILADGAAGRLVPVRDEAALAQAILASLDDPIPVETLRAQAQVFEMGRVIQQYREMLGI